MRGVVGALKSQLAEKNAEMKALKNRINVWRSRNKGSPFDVEYKAALGMVDTEEREKALATLVEQWKSMFSGSEAQSGSAVVGAYKHIARTRGPSLFLPGECTCTVPE
jgi:hypothetical protein